MYLLHEAQRLRLSAAEGGHRFPEIWRRTVSWGVFSCFSMLSNFGGKPGIVIFTLDSEYYSIPVNTLELCSVPWLRSSETV